MTDFQEELLLQSEELPLPDLGSMDLMEMLEMQIMERLLNFLIRITRHLKDFYIAHRCDIQ